MKYLLPSLYLFIFISLFSCSQSIDTSKQEYGNIEVIFSDELSKIIDNVKYNFDFSLSNQTTYLTITYTLKKDINYHPGVRGFRILEGNVFDTISRDEYSPPSTTVKLWNRYEVNKVDINYLRNGKIIFSLGSISAKATKIIYLYKD